MSGVPEEALCGVHLGNGATHRFGATMTVYGKPVVSLSDLRDAQAVVDEHAAEGLSGVCRICRVEIPCGPRWFALRTLEHFGRLPQRLPGATLPETSARPWNAFG